MVIHYMFSQTVERRLSAFMCFGVKQYDSLPKPVGEKNRIDTQTYEGIEIDQGKEQEQSG